MSKLALLFIDILSVVLTKLALCNEDNELDDDDPTERGCSLGMFG